MTKERKQELDALCDEAIAKETATGQPVMLESPVEFYSPGCPGLMLCPYNGRIMKSENGSERRVDEVIAQFTPHTNVKTGPNQVLRIGFYSTNHPRAVKWLLDRLMQPSSDITDTEGYSELAIPATERLKVEKLRVIETKNELEKELAKNKQLEEEVAALRAAARSGKRPTPTEAAIAAAG